METNGLEDEKIMERNFRFGRRHILSAILSMLSFGLIKPARAEISCSCLPPPNCDDVCEFGGNPRGDGTQACDCNEEPTGGNVALSDAYPVGAIYMSVMNTDPSTLFGGVWQALDEGRVLIGAGTAHPAGETGGEATHTLTTNEMPSHTHSGSTSSAGSHSHTVSYPKGDKVWENGSGNTWWGRTASTSKSTGSSGSHSHSMSLNNTGGGAAHNNMQPYLAVYMWMRTA